MSFLKEKMAGQHNDLNFVQVNCALRENKIIYVDVRNQSELITDGKVPGSFVIPRKKFSCFTISSRLFLKLLYQVTEIEQAFTLDENAFLSKYGFAKPARNASNVVIACRSGRRVEQAIEIFDRLGFHSLW